MNDLNQVVVYGFGNLQGLHGSGTGGGEMPGIRHELIHLHRSRIGAGNGVAELAVGTHQPFKGLTTNVTLIIVDEGGIGALRQRRLGAIRQGNVRELQIHIGQHGVNIVRCTGNLAHHGQ